MGKRSSGEGTIVKRADGRWMGAVSPSDGRRKWLYGKTQQEVARKIAATRRDRDDGLPVVSERRTLESYLRSWLEMCKPGVKPNTWKSYEYVARLHTIPGLGRTTLTKLTPEMVQRWLAQKQTSGSLSITTVRYLHSVLRLALGEALRLGLVQRNVCASVKKPRRRRIEMRWWTPEQARMVLEAAKGDRLYALFVLALSTGMRASEMLGLRWRDLDLGKRTLTVQTQLQWRKVEGGRVLRFDEVKTDAGRRKITLAPHVVEALRAHRAAQRSERLKLGPIWRENDLMFCNGIGGGLDLGNVRSRTFLPVVREAGVPCIRPHDMRHTAATIAILNGMPIKAVSEMLGHSSVAITMGIYAHVLPNTHRDVADAMGAILFSPAEGVAGS